MENHSLLILNFILIFINGVYCDEQATKKIVEVSISSDARNIVYFALLLVFGLINIFLGSRLFKLSNFTSGFIFLFLVSHFIVGTFKLNNSNQNLAFFIACNILGGIGGAVCAFIPSFGAFLGSFIMGATITNLILCAASLKTFWLGWCLISILGLITGLIGVSFQKYLFPLSSAVNGSQLLVLGVSLLINEECFNYIQQFCNQKFGEFISSPTLAVLFGSLIPISLVGFLFQLKFFKVNLVNAADVSILKRKRRMTLPSSPLPLTPIQRMTSASSTKPIIDRKPKPIDKI